MCAHHFSTNIFVVKIFIKKIKKGKVCCSISKNRIFNFPSRFEKESDKFQKKTQENFLEFFNFLKRKTGNFKIEMKGKFFLFFRQYKIGRIYATHTRFPHGVIFARKERKNFFFSPCVQFVVSFYFEFIFFQFS